MQIVWAIIVGFIAGVIAKRIMPGRDPGGFIITTLLGMAGAVLATWIGRAAGWYGPEQGAGLIGGIIGALIILAIYHLIRGYGRGTRSRYGTAP